MKKLISFCLAMLLLCSNALAEVKPTAKPTFKPTTAPTAAPAFDQSKIKTSTLYNYDKFDKSWNIQGSYEKNYRDCSMEICLLMFDTYVEKGWGPELRLYYFDKEANHYDNVTGFRAIIGEKLYSFERLSKSSAGNAGYAFACETMKEFCTALSKAKKGEVAFQIDHTDMYGQSWTSTIDPVDMTDLKELIDMAKLLNRSNAWSIVEDLEVADLQYFASVE